MVVHLLKSSYPRPWQLRAFDFDPHVMVSHAMAFELDASQPLAALTLNSPSNIHARHLLVYRDFAEPQSLDLKEEIRSTTGTSSHTHHVPHKFRFKRDVASARYTVETKNRSEWIIDLICDGIPVPLSFSRRQDVHELQCFFTGYPVRDHFEGVKALATLKGGRMFSSRSEHHGIAEIQVWESQEQRPAQDPSRMTPTSMPSSHGQNSTPSIATSEVSTSDTIATRQTVHRDGRQAVVSHLAPPPVLVLFLREKEKARYTMLKIDCESLVLCPRLISSSALTISRSGQYKIQPCAQPEWMVLPTALKR